MKIYSLTFLLVLVLGLAQAQDTEKILPTKLKAATVFFSGAQLQRTGTIQIPKGVSKLKVVNLSPDIEQESIRVKAGNDFRILSVSYTLNYMQTLENSDQVKQLKAKIEALTIEQEDIQIEKSALSSKLQFLKKNNQVISQKKGITPADYQALAALYADEYYQTEKQTLALNRKYTIATKERRKLQSQLNSIHSKNNQESSEIFLTVSSKVAKSAKFEVSYFMPSASWVPSYDIRHVNTSKPLEIVHKANIVQNSGVDWKNIKLTLSNANPSQSGQYQELTPYYLKYNYAQKTSYKPQMRRKRKSDLYNALQGQVAGVQVTEGGFYEQKRSRNTVQRRSSYLVDGVLQGRDPNISPDNVESIRVLKNNADKAAQGFPVAGNLIVIRTKQRLTTKSSGISETKNSTQVEFVIKSPYSIASDQKPITIETKTDNVPATYVYRSVPLLEEEAFLIAQIGDWEKVGLLSGGINIYSDNTYVGESFLDIQAVSDTLNISIGRDKNIVVKHKVHNNFNSKQLVGSKKKELHKWEVSARNLKNKSITLEVFDQIPVSTEKTIALEVLEVSNANHNPVTGGLKWILDLKPQETKKMNISYELKYPKDKVIESKH